MIAVADAILLPLADQSVDLVFGSPPYCDARTYGIGADRKCEEWIDWMLEVTCECLRVSRGAVMWVCAGVTRDRTYWPAPEGLLYEWWKRGGSSYRPVYWHRVGIPGSGGDQWLRADVEYVLCFKRGGPLPFADNTVMGHAPKWAPGGEMSNRTGNGRRCNQWGSASDCAATGKNGKRQKAWKPSHRTHTKSRADGHDEIQNYTIPVLANPGNLIKTNVGGGLLGSDLAHENEAPFPEKLAEFFVRSWCLKNGTVLDPFGGSGTTAAVCKRFHRRYLSFDIRESQAHLARRRLHSTQVELFG